VYDEEEEEEVLLRTALLILPALLLRLLMDFRRWRVENMSDTREVLEDIGRVMRRGRVYR
jgi:hypothetical protein